MSKAENAPHDAETQWKREVRLRTVSAVEIGVGQTGNTSFGLGLEEHAGRVMEKRDEEGQRRFLGHSESSSKMEHRVVSFVCDVCVSKSDSRVEE